jgi:hypothetical protein
LSKIVSSGEGEEAVNRDEHYTLQEQAEKTGYYPGPDTTSYRREGVKSYIFYIRRKK